MQLQALHRKLTRDENDVLIKVGGDEDYSYFSNDI
jgi:hypothetical protein